MKYKAIVLLSLFTLLASACGPGEKSRELNDLETILQDPEAKNVREAPGASKPYREARQFRNLALEAWEEGKTELSVEYSILGTLRYRTAAAIKEQVEAKQRLDEANAKIETSNPEVVVLTQERNKLNQEVTALERQVNLARTRNPGLSGPTAEMKQQVSSRLSDAEAAKKQADLVEAKTHAPKEYNSADNLLKSTRRLLAGGQATPQMVNDAAEAQQLFLASQKAAEPKFQAAAARSNPEQRRQNLRTDASKLYGSESVITERLGARIVLASLFKPGQSLIDSSMRVSVDELVKLASTYEEFDIYIEGFTSKTGSATENLGLSQIRANAVRDALTAGGVKSSRIETRGFGQDRLRFGAQDQRNERVEVVMSRPN